MRFSKCQPSEEGVACLRPIWDRLQHPCDPVEDVCMNSLINTLFMHNVKQLWAHDSWSVILILLFAACVRAMTSNRVLLFSSSLCARLFLHQME